MGGGSGEEGIEAGLAETKEKLLEVDAFAGAEAAHDGFVVEIGSSQCFQLETMTTIAYISIKVGEVGTARALAVVAVGTGTEAEVGRACPVAAIVARGCVGVA